MSGEGERKSERKRQIGGGRRGTRGREAGRREHLSRARAGDCTAVAGKKSQYDEQSSFLRAAAHTSRRAGRVEGNRIDTAESWRMSGSGASGEASEP